MADKFVIFLGKPAVLRRFSASLSEYRKEKHSSMRRAEK
jgi:hypothetical protein